jgi:hypothetical protein
VNPRRQPALSCSVRDIGKRNILGRADDAVGSENRIQTTRARVDTDPVPVEDAGG